MIIISIIALLIFSCLYLKFKDKVFIVMFLLPFLIIQTIVIPLCLLPIALVMRLMNFPSSFWAFTTYNVFFRIFNIHFKIDGKFIDQGFILSNHRSWCDFAYDPYISGSIIVGRTLAFIAMIFQTLLGIIDKRVICINRNNSRQEIFDQILNYVNSPFAFSKKVLFWPEGTRKNYTTLSKEEAKNIIKPGLLKSIYEHKKYPVQIMISKNKEEILNEKTIKIKFGETIHTKLSTPINPEDFKTFEEFLEKVHNEWYNIFNELYTSR